MPIAKERYLVISAPLVMIRLLRLQDWIMLYLPEKTGTVYHRHRAFFIEATALLRESAERPDSLPL